MYVSLMYKLRKILLSNMSRPETFGMALVGFTAFVCAVVLRPLKIRLHVRLETFWLRLAVILDWR